MASSEHQRDGSFEGPSLEVSRAYEKGFDGHTVSGALALTAILAAELMPVPVREASDGRREKTLVEPSFVGLALPTAQLVNQYLPRLTEDHRDRYGSVVDFSRNFPDLPMAARSELVHRAIYGDGAELPDIGVMTEGVVEVHRGKGLVVSWTHGAAAAELLDLLPDSAREAILKERQDSAAQGVYKLQSLGRPGPQVLQGAVDLSSLAAAPALQIDRPREEIFGAPARPASSPDQLYAWLEGDLQRDGRGVYGPSRRHLRVAPEPGEVSKLEAAQGLAAPEVVAPAPVNGETPKLSLVPELLQESEEGASVKTRPTRTLDVAVATEAALRSEPTAERIMAMNRQLAHEAIAAALHEAPVWTTSVRKMVKMIMKSVIAFEKSGRELADENQDRRVRFGLNILLERHGRWWHPDAWRWNHRREIRRRIKNALLLPSDARPHIIVAIDPSYKYSRNKRDRKATHGVALNMPVKMKDEPEPTQGLGEGFFEGELEYFPPPPVATAEQKRYRVPPSFGAAAQQPPRPAERSFVAPVAFIGSSGVPSTTSGAWTSSAHPVQPSVPENLPDNVRRIGHPPRPDQKINPWQPPH